MYNINVIVHKLAIQFVMLLMTIFRIQAHQQAQPMDGFDTDLDIHLESKRITLHLQVISE